MKKSVFLLLAFVLIASLAIAVIPRVENKDELHEALEKIASFKKAAEEQGIDTTNGKEQVLIPTTYVDKDGNEIRFYNYMHVNVAIDDRESMLTREVVDIQTADSRKQIMVGDTQAVIYEKDKRSYLIWDYSDVYSFIIDYDPSQCTEEDMITMAESVQ